jgi:hypothetical protein
MGSDIAEAQIDDLSDAEVDVLLEIYEVLRLTPDNGRMLRQAGNMYVWDYNGISVTYVLLDPQREVAVLRVAASPPEKPATAHEPGSRDWVAGMDVWMTPYLRTALSCISECNLRINACSCSRSAPPDPISPSESIRSMTPESQLATSTALSSGIKPRVSR